MRYHNELNELLEGTQLPINELPEEWCGSTKLEIIRDYKIETTGIEKIFSLTDHFIEKFKHMISPTYSKTRPMIGFIKSTYPKKDDLIGCEVGVSKGYNAKNISTKLNCKKLFLVDPYLQYTENNKIYDFSEHKKIAKKVLSKFNKTVEFIEKKSDDAINYIPDNLDFVYIDANHEYKYVKKDIELYYKKVKLGGIIGGHDFGAHRTVTRAVLDFIDENNIADDECFNSGCDWWIAKRN